MLISIKLSNFYSFKDEAIFSFSSTLKSDESDKVIAFKKYNLNKTNVIYGANASGKSNFLKWVKFIKDMIIFSHDQNKTPSKLLYKPYLLSADTKPSVFEISFVLEDEIYNYMFSIDPTTEEVIEESLIKYTSQKPSKLFVRKGNVVKTTKFQEAEERKTFLRSNALAISVFSNTNWALSLKIRDYFLTKVHVFSSPNDGNTPLDTFEMFDKYNDKFKNFLTELLNFADINVADVVYKKEKKNIGDLPQEHQSALVSSMPSLTPLNQIESVEMKYAHNKYNSLWENLGKIEFNADQESTGTNKLTNIWGSLYNVIFNNMTLFVDELDNSLHPMLVREIVKLFNSSRNPHSQLVFISHDISLLDDWILNNDQIRFVDKHKYWWSSLYSLSEFKWLSSIKSIQKAYLQWRFDAIPAISEFDFSSSNK